MKNPIVFIVFTIILFMSISISTALELPLNDSSVEKNQESEVEYHALIVSINNYTYRPEDYLDKDAAVMYDILVNSKNWEAENIKILLNENATKQSIYENITTWLADREDQNDVVLIYISGHGWKVPIHRRLQQGYAYYVPYDCSYWEFDESQISDKELNSWINELDSKHITIVLDHCYAGRMLSVRKAGRVVLTAGGKYLLCPVDGDKNLGQGHAIFSFFLFQGLKGIADINNDGWVSAEEAFRYSRFPTFWFSAFKHFPYLTNEYGYLTIIGPQFPFIYDRYLGNLPLVQYQ